MKPTEKLIVSLDEIKMNNRFNLEEEIQKVWNTEEDLDTILYRIMDAPEVPSEDEI